ncbi:MAG: bifunctional riboflavin kinase/FAD synthetase [Clostridia bacterium]|nr:bifunctional riboflavin kinase/FAD synthetase [Clostridia bacterium]
MQIIKNVDEIRKLNIPLAICLGNFDGVHKGHQALLKSCIKESHSKLWSSSVLLWNPHPTQVLKGDKTPDMLITAEQKFTLMESLGMDYLLYLPFNKDVASLSSLEFVKEYLVNILNVNKVFIGFNYSFGKNAEGTPEKMKLLCKQLGIEVFVGEPIKIDNEVISSTLIRKRFIEGDILRTAKLLGYYPILEGDVVNGDHRGSCMGFPTANIDLHDNQALPAFGVYACYAEYNDRILPAIVNIGVKPTFGSVKAAVEVHIFDFNEIIYSKWLKIHLIKRMRSEVKFRNSDELKLQIKHDIEVAHNILENNDANSSNIFFVRK